jgi:hypothetical protein
MDLVMHAIGLHDSQDLIRYLLLGPARIHGEYVCAVEQPVQVFVQERQRSVMEPEGLPDPVAEQEARVEY